MPVFKRSHIPNLSVGAANLQRVCWLRGILVSIEALCLLLACQVFNIQLPVFHFLLVTLLYFMVISFTWWRLEFIASPVTGREFFLQLLVDVISLSLFLYLTGGYTNPLVSLLLIPTSIGAALLSERFSWSLSATAILAYTCLMIWYQPISSSMNHQLSGNDQQMISLHLVGMWATFVISVSLITYFVIHMASALRKQKAAIATNRERQLRDENILAIAIQAAGTAHELGTPLATMAVLLSDLKEEYARQPNLDEDLTLLQSQVQECKQRLKKLVDQSQHIETERISVRHFLHHVQDQWQLLRPDILLNMNLPEWSETTQILCDPSLYQSFIALLDNAADASPKDILLSAQLANNTIIIQIDDQGQGIPVAIAEQLGTVIYSPYSSDKQSGLGLGLLLSQASIERLGGKVHLYNRAPCGTRTEIHLVRD